MGVKTGMGMKIGLGCPHSPCSARGRACARRSPPHRALTRAQGETGRRQLGPLRLDAAAWSASQMVGVERLTRAAGREEEGFVVASASASAFESPNARKRAVRARWIAGSVRVTRDGGGF